MLCYHACQDILACIVVKNFYTVSIGDPLVHNGKNYKQAYHKTWSAVKYEQRVKVTEVKRFPH